VNLGHPIVTNGTLLCSCAEMREPIELSFAMVSGLDQALVHSMGSTCCKEKGQFPGL